MPHRALRFSLLVQPLALVTLAASCSSSSSTGSSADGGPRGASGSSGATSGSGGALAGNGGSGVSGAANTGGSSGTSNGGTANGNGGASNGGTANGGASNGGTGNGSGGAPSGSGLSTKYPGDVGIENDPDVVWTENFEEGSIAALVARYDDSKQPGLGFDTDVPLKSAGSASGKLTANGAGPNAVDFFKKLPGYDELFVRYYAKYEAGVPWHHTGVWVGGYNPPTNYPNPQAGLLPNGDDRFSVSLEPMEQNLAAPRMDFYNYWMKMRSWMDVPTGTTAYYGNSLVHDPTLTAKEQWQCIELHILLNPDPASGAGAELGVWVDDQSIMQFTDTAPLGYWVKDKFCPDSAVGTDCTNYKPANPTLVPLDLQYRSTAALKLNVFWPQNYITDTGGGSVWYDDMVLAKSRVGCLR